MTIDRIVLVFAGTMILLGTLLAATVTPYALFLTGFVGANLLQSAFTGFCPLAKILRASGCTPGQLYD
jgi:Inner membrane protein YgaP-like, transmembrane domain